VVLFCLTAGASFHLCCLQVSIDRLASLDIVHRLFESVAASVFRPIDILLKVLFAKPVKLVSSVHSSWSHGDILGSNICCVFTGKVVVI